MKYFIKNDQNKNSKKKTKKKDVAKIWKYIMLKQKSTHLLEEKAVQTATYFKLFWNLRLHCDVIHSN